MQSRLFASGFRASFFAAGAAATVLVPVWMLIWGFGGALLSAWPPTVWHAHEMLFGFVAAAMAGFLLTAVPSWTGQRGFAGRPLVLLMSLWLAARLLIATSSRWPPLLVAAVDVGFLVTLGILIALPLIRSTNRNTPLLLVIALFAGCNAVSHWALAHRDPEMAYRAILVGIDIALLAVTLIGGRIVPAFTASALRSSGSPVVVRTWHWLTPAALIAMIAVGLTDLFWYERPLAGIVAAMAAGIQTARMLQWRGFATLRQPIVWVLHAGYAWLPVGLALKALALLTGLAISAFWLHALTIGALATMIMAVMTRASLGHTGRALVVDPAIALAYLLLLAAAFVRVFGLGVSHLPYLTVVVISGSCWTAAFGIFLVIYAPILWSPRADGKPG